MSRYIGPVCRQCRREGTKLFLKGDRCFTEKCGVERRAYPPGQHGQGRTRVSVYGLQLREKQ
jgi:small subunit ribosomal protein S4